MLHSSSSLHVHFPAVQPWSWVVPGARGQSALSAHEHWPETRPPAMTGLHVNPTLQAVPQVPQFCTSLERSRHVPAPPPEEQQNGIEFTGELAVRQDLLEQS